LLKVQRKHEVVREFTPLLRCTLTTLQRIRIYNNAFVCFAEASENALPQSPFGFNVSEKPQRIQHRSQKEHFLHNRRHFYLQNSDAGNCSYYQCNLGSATLHLEHRILHHFGNIDIYTSSITFRKHLIALFNLVYHIVLHFWFRLRHRTSE